jgi:steroid delta-isomerase-like uncharacterized protein
MSEQSKSVVRRVVEEHWNKKNSPVVAEIFDVKATLYTPDGTLHGHDGVKQLLAGYAGAFPDFRVQIDELLSEGDNVTLRWTFTGTHKGPLGEIAASGKTVSVSGIGTFRVAAGRAREVHLIWDKYALMQQIGALARQAAR